MAYYLSIKGKLSPGAQAPATYHNRLSNYQSQTGYIFFRLNDVKPETMLFFDCYILVNESSSSDQDYSLTLTWQTPVSVFFS